ncbi:MAG: porin family protein [Bacteroidota bacterium]
MKRALALLIISITVISSINGQTVFKGGLSLGITASQISGDQLSGFNKAGIFGGAFVNFRFTTRSALQFEMNYIQKGSAHNPKPGAVDPHSYKLNLQYIEIPILYNWLFNKRFEFELGPTVAFLMKSTEKDEGGIMPDTRPFNWYEVGVLGGIQFNISENFRAGFRGQNSILPVRNHAGNVTYRLNRGQYNSLLLLNLTYEFSSRKKD